MNLNEKTYNAVLSETQDLFQAQGLSIIGEGYKEIATNAALFESYVESLTEGASADSAATMAQLMANTNANILKESSMTGIQPIASLSMPVIRKLWPKFALKDAIKTEVAKTPRFVVAYTKPYMENAKGERVYLAKGLAGDDFAGNKAEGIDLFDRKRALHKEFTRGHVVELSAGAAAVVDFLYQNGKDGDKDEHVFVENTPSGIKIQPLDELFVEAYVVKGAAVTDGDASKQYVRWSYKELKGAKVDGNYVNDGLGVVNGDDLEGTAYELVDVIKIGKRLGVYGSQVYAAGKGQLLVQFDGKNHTAT